MCHVEIQCFFEKYGGPWYQTRGFTVNNMISKHGTPFHDLVIHRLNMAELLVTHILKATTKGSKSGFSTKSSQIDHFT